MPPAWDLYVRSRDGLSADDPAASDDEEVAALNKALYKAWKALSDLIQVWRAT